MASEFADDAIEPLFPAAAADAPGGLPVDPAASFDVSMPPLAEDAAAASAYGEGTEESLSAATMPSMDDDALTGIEDAPSFDSSDAASETTATVSNAFSAEPPQPPAPPQMSVSEETAATKFAVADPNEAESVDAESVEVEPTEPAIDEPIAAAEDSFAEHGLVDDASAPVAAAESDGDVTESAELTADVSDESADTANAAGDSVAGDTAADDEAAGGETAGDVTADEGAADDETAGEEPEYVGKHRRQKSSPGTTIFTAFLVLLMIAGIGLIAYPSVADWWNRMHASYVVAGYVQQTEDLTAAKKADFFAAAHAYNAKLAESSKSNSNRWYLNDEELKEYNETLDITGTGIMGYVSIPKLKVQLPIYHTVDDDVLQIAAGHLPGSSLPVGGESTHAVVSGHTGLPSATLFTGLTRLVKGDTFSFTVLDETMTYEVDDIQTVLPYQLDGLSIVDGADLATLVTCTPYGINSHRLLVRGHRIPTPVETTVVTYDSPVIMTLITCVIVGLVLLALGILIVVLLKRSRARALAAADPTNEREMARRGRHISG